MATPARDPWMKFYPQDWRSDEKLRMCSLAARGLWIEMLAIMHRSERYGQLLIGGRVPTDAQLAVQVGALPDEVKATLAELEDAGVFSRAVGGVIYSRRMTRDHKKAEIARKNGKKGGNPSLGNKREKQSSVNPSDKGGVKAQKPEARSQISANADSAGARGEIDIPDFVQRCCSAAGLSAPDPMRDWNKHNDLISLVQGWIDAGADPDTIRKTITDRAAVARSQVKSLRWFDGAVRDAITAAEAKSDVDPHIIAMAEKILERNKREAAA